MARESTWLLSALGALLGTGLALLFVIKPFGLTHAWLRGIAWQASVQDSRTALASVLGTVITTLSIVLSLSLLVLQNTAQQYSLRLLRLFMRPLGPRLTIPVFVTTGAYCLVGVYAFGFVQERGVAPRPALSLAMLLLACCGGALALQLAYTLDMVRAEKIVRRVRVSSLDLAHELNRLRRQDAQSPAATPALPETKWSVPALSSGFIVNVDARNLLELASRQKLVIHVNVAIGDPVVRGATLAQVAPEGVLLAEDRARISRWVERTMIIGPWREPDWDLALGVRQLVDIAIKALSPGINDPSTAVESLDQLTILLCGLCELRQGPRTLTDAMGRPCVVLHALEFRDYLLLATEQIARYGASEPAIVLRLLRLAGEVGLRASEEPVSRAAREVLEQVSASTEVSLRDSWCLPLLRRYAQGVEQALERREPLPPLPSLGF